jgi:hypothetical protein
MGIAAILIEVDRFQIDVDTILLRRDEIVDAVDAILSDLNTVMIARDTIIGRANAIATVPDARITLPDAVFMSHTPI